VKSWHFGQVFVPPFQQHHHPSHNNLDTQPTSIDFIKTSSLIAQFFVIDFNNLTA
jgi:hypothetical protein